MNPPKLDGFKLYPLTRWSRHWHLACRGFARHRSWWPEPWRICRKRNGRSWSDRSFKLPGDEVKILIYFGFLMIFCSKKMVLWGKRREHDLLTRGFSLRYGIFWKSIGLGEPQDLAGKYGCSSPKVKHIRVFKDLIPTWVCWETPQNMLFDGDDHTDSLKSRILKEPIGTVLVFGPLKPQAKVMRQEDVEVNLQQCNMCITAFGRMTRWQDAVERLLHDVWNEGSARCDQLQCHHTCIESILAKGLGSLRRNATNGACGPQRGHLQHDHVGMCRQRAVGDGLSLPEWNAQGESVP